jgi:dolichol-phosphate mannosyltransferase
MDGRSKPRATAPWSLSLIIPAFNEEAGILQAIAEADGALAELAGDYEILVVDDGSSDGTAKVVAEAARVRPRVRLLRHGENRGYGAALRTGFVAARFDRVAFTDADSQFDLRDLAALVPLTQEYPLAVGYRVERQDPWRRRIFSRGYNVLVRALLGTRVRDCDCAFKVLRKEAVIHLLPRTNGFFVNAEMLTRARQRGYRVAEVGVQHRPRLKGTSKVALADIPRTLATLLPFWWSCILFPAQPPPTGSETRDGRTGGRCLDLGFWALVLAAGLLFFSRLHCPLLEPDEARYAEIPRQMLAEGRWVVPVLHGQPYCHKPPLLYWLVMGAYSVLGIHDWAARLVPCAAAFLSVLGTYFWGRRTVGARAALGGAFMLCLSARFVYLGRMLTMDSLLSLWIVLSWAAGHVAVRRGVLSWRWWLTSAGACGLGLLTKGPVALVLTTVPVLACQVLDGRLARPRLGAWMAYLGVALGLAGPWYGAVALRNPALLSEFFWTHNWLRFMQPIDHQGPLWYYPPGLLLGMLPWTLLLPSLVKALARRSGVAAARRPAGLGLFLLAFLWCLVFFSAAGCKRPGYILPAMPPLALALGCHLDAVLPRQIFQRVRAIASRRQDRLAYRATLLVLTVGLAGGVLAVSEGFQKPLPGLLMAAGAVGGLVYLRRRGPSSRAGASWAACGGITFVLLLIAQHQMLPGYERKFSLRDQVRPHRHVPLDPHTPVVCYPHRWDSVSFYLNGHDVRVYPPSGYQRLIADLRAQPSTLVFIKSEDPQGHALPGLLRDLPASLEFVMQGPPGLVTAGLVRRRAEVPSTVFAQR